MIVENSIVGNRLCEKSRDYQCVIDKNGKFECFVTGNNLKERRKKAKKAGLKLYGVMFHATKWRKIG